MRIVSYNVNGLRAYLNKDPGIYDIREYINPDVLCLQETKASEDYVKTSLGSYFANDICIKSCSNNWKLGYAGVSTLSKESYLKRNINIMPEYGEGRLVLTELDSHTMLINVYTLNSGSDKEELRDEWDAKFLDYLRILKYNQGYKLIICGDLNTVLAASCHWSGEFNRFDHYLNTGPGLYDFERNNLKTLISELKLENIEPMNAKYTWFRYTDREEKYGWRLDYFLVDKELVPLVSSCQIVTKMRYSDHRPIVLDINI